MAGPHLGVEPDQVMGGQVERRAEALDLERPRELASEAVPHAVRSDDDERQVGKRDHAGTEREADDRFATAALLPRPPSATGTSTAGKSLTATAAPSSTKPSRSRRCTSAASAPATSAVG